MPYLTSLAEGSLLFENAYAVYPESIKGLFAILCSRYPAFRMSAEISADIPCPSLASRLTAAGYIIPLVLQSQFQRHPDADKTATLIGGPGEFTFLDVAS